MAEQTDVGGDGKDKNAKKTEKSGCEKGAVDKDEVEETKGAAGLTVGQK